MPRGVRVAIAPHGGWVAPMRGQTRVLGNGVPKRQVALGSAQRIGAAQAPSGARVYPAQGPDNPSARCPCVGSVIVSARSS